MDSRKTGLTMILTVMWYVSVLFFASQHVFAETPIDHIRAELRSREVDARIAAVEKLRHRKDEETVGLLISVAGNIREAWEVQVKAIQLLGEAKNPKAVDLLLHIFNSHSGHWECPAIKSYTASALGNFGGEPGVTDALINGLHDPELHTREASVRALGIIRDEKTLPSLVPLLRDRSIAIRLSVIKAVENIGDRRVIPALKVIAEDDRDEVVRNTAKVALSNFHKNQPGLL
jgi:HEAT repeat protein